MLLSVLWSSFFDERLSSTISARLETLIRLRQQQPEIADEFYRRFAAEVEGDSPTFDPKDLERVLDAARASGNSIAMTTGVFRNAARSASIAKLEICTKHSTSILLSYICPKRNTF